MCYGTFDIENPDCPTKENGKRIDALIFETDGFNPNEIPVGAIVKAQLNRLNDSGNAFIAEFQSVKGDEQEYNDLKNNALEQLVEVRAFVSQVTADKITKVAKSQRTNKKQIAGMALDRLFADF